MECRALLVRTKVYADCVLGGSVGTGPLSPKTRGPIGAYDVLGDQLGLGNSMTTSLQTYELSANKRTVLEDQVGWEYL